MRALLASPIIACLAGAASAQSIPQPALPSASSVSVVLVPAARRFDHDRVAQGVVRFTASIKNNGRQAVVIAHPSICVPADYKQGQPRSLRDGHGKSELLFSVLRPDGTRVTLRDGHMHYFDPGNVPLLTIAPNEIRMIEIGWFFQNARGRWERDDEAATVFAASGKYEVTLTLRNVFPKALVYDERARRMRDVDVWTGVVESPPVEIEVR